MADSAVETQETPVVVEKETVTSSVKETNGAAKNGAAKNGDGDHAEEPKENGKSTDNGDAKEGEAEEEESKENGVEEDVCALKRKSAAGDAEAPTPEKKAKVTEETPAEESNDAEAVEA